MRLGRGLRKGLGKEIESRTLRTEPAEHRSRFYRFGKWIQPWVTLTALVLAAWSFRFAVESSRQHGDKLKQLNSAFDRTSASLEGLPASVEKFDQTVRGMSEAARSQQQVIGASLDTLTNQLHGFSERLVNYRDQLDKVVAVTDRQVELVAKRQELLEKELGRRSELVLRFDTDVIDSGFREVFPVVINKGNSPSRFYTFFFDLSRSLRVEKRGVCGIQDAGPDSVHMSCTVVQPVGFLDEPGKYFTVHDSQWRFVIKSPPTVGRVKVRYIIAYEHASRHDSTNIVPEGRVFR
ncbi:MAG: hypothetical protein AB1792_02435 [Candidatus Zixiibacteriota bacterium]